ncbi:MAG: hypothetical protein ACP5OH_03495 [Nitrososphaerota archaeon]
MGINIITNVYGQDEEGDTKTNNEIPSQLGSGEFDNFTTPSRKIFVRMYKLSDSSIRILARGSVTVTN